MKEIFSLRRFGKYLLHDIRNFRIRYGITMLILGLFPFISYLIAYLAGLLKGNWMPPQIELPPRLLIMAIAFFAFIISMPAKVYGHITDKRAGSDWLMLPASTFEKFLSTVLLGAVVAPVVLTALYLFSDFLLCVSSPSLGTPIAALNLNDLLFDGRDFSETGIYFPLHGFTFLIPAIFSSILFFLLGAVLFRKRKITNTILCSIGLTFLLSFFISLLAAHGIMAEYDMQDWIYKHLEHSEFYLNLIIHAVNGIQSAILLAAIYFRMKTIRQ